MSAPARILLCHDYYVQPGGENTVFDTQVRGLRERGHTVTVYTRHNDEIAGMGPLARASLLVEAHDSRRTRREITALVEKDRSEVAIVQNVFPLISPSVYDVLQRRGIRVLQAVYNYRLVSPAGELFSRGEICERSLGGNYLHCVARRCYRGSAVMSAWYASILGLHRRRRTFARLIDCFLVPDAFMANKLSEGGLPAERMQPIVSPFFVREHAPSETHDGYVAFVGRLVAHKGVRTLIEAARLAGPNCRVVLVGTGELEGEVRARIARDGLDGRVRLLGPRWGDELRTIVRGAAAVAIPSEWYDNLPLVSYVVLRGRCRDCGARIPLVYPAVELITALLIAGCVFAFGLTAEAAVAAFFCSVLVAVSAIDLEHRIIPNRIVVPAAGVVLLANTALNPSPEWVLGALGGAGFLFAAALVYPAGMGMGDVKLALLMGAALGKLVGVAMMIGMLAALVPGIYLMARHGQAARKMGIPFAPFLAIGSIVALFAGGFLLDWYLGILGA